MNKDVEVEEHHRNLLLTKNKKHMSYEFNNFNLAIRNDKFEVVCAMCKQCLIIANHDVCVLNYVNAMNSRDANQSANISNVANQKKHKLKVKKPKKVTMHVLLTLRNLQANGFQILLFLGQFLGTIRFGNDHIATILGYGDLQWGYIQGLLTAEKRISPLFMYSRLSVILRMVMKTLGNLVQKLSAMDFEERSSKPGLQSMTSGQISSGLDLTCAPSTITSQKPTECELDLLFEAMYDDYSGGQQSVALRTAPATSAPRDVDELPQEQHVQQKDNQAPLQPEIVADNFPNAMIDGDVFENPFAPPSISSSESSSLQYVDPSNMHTFYQPYKHDYQ
ncbi:hypothetical protein Tco_0716995 [Tanacetum coccineum]